MATKKTNQQKLEQAQAKVEQAQATVEQAQAKVEQAQAKVEQAQAKVEQAQAKVEVERAETQAIEQATVAPCKAIDNAQKSVADDLRKAEKLGNASGFYIMRSVDKVLKSIANNKDIQLVSANTNKPIDKPILSKFKKLLSIFLGGHDINNDGSFYYAPEASYLTEYKIKKASLFGLNFSRAMAIKDDKESIEQFFKDEILSFRISLFANFADETGKIDYAGAYKYYSSLPTVKESKIYGMIDAVRFMVKKFNGHADTDLQDFINQLKEDYKNVL